MSVTLIIILNNLHSDNISYDKVTKMFKSVKEKKDIHLNITTDILHLCLKEC